MKISLNWVKEYTDVKLPLDELVEKIGLQLGAVDEVIDVGAKYKGIVIVKVVKCDKHPNADKLSVCLIDDGGVTKGVKRNKDGLVQVVCGAPNVHTDMLAVWLPPGVTVPSSFDKEPFVLDARELRGIVSNGMLASASELAISEDHSGIVELTEGKPGNDFAAALKLNDYIIDVENKMFTHRPDLFGILGVAREIAGITGKQFKSPGWYQSPERQCVPSLEKDQLKFGLKNEIPKLVPRFMARVIQGVKVEPSPMALQVRLSSIGIRPINNIVDVTNYIMYLTGQPMHAYDYDKLENGIIIRHGKKGEKLKLLGGKEIALREQDIVIADHKKPIGLGGVMGGADTEVDESTKNIVLEVANFDMYTIRRTAMEHGLFTDAVTRFTKGQSPYQIDRVMALAVNSIVGEEPGGIPEKTIYDDKHLPKEKKVIKVEVSFINERLGEKLSGEQMKKLLENVEIDTELNGGVLHAVPPFWRTDLEIPEDIVEEIGRLYGYQHISLNLPTRTITPTPKDQLLATQQEARGMLAAAGANEVLTYTFVHGNLLDSVGQDKKLAYQVANALSPDLQYYRLSLLPSLLEKVHPNIKAGFNEFAMFEINPVHSKDLTSGGLPIEDQRLALVFAAEEKTARSTYSGAAYYQAKKYLDILLEHLGIDAVYSSAENYTPKMGIGKAALAPFEKSRTAIVKTRDGKLLAEIGEFSASTRKNLKLPVFAAGFELDIAAAMEAGSKTSRYQPLPRFPKVEQDITLKVDSKVEFKELFDFLNNEILKQEPQHTRHGLVPLDIYQKSPADKHKNISFRLEIASYQRTLTTDTVNKLLDSVASRAKEKLGAERV
jgi:phenylalanyl-tRNA synthetase beta chain